MLVVVAPETGNFPWTGWFVWESMAGVVSSPIVLPAWWWLGLEPPEIGRAETVDNGTDVGEGCVGGSSVSSIRIVPNWVSSAVGGSVEVA